jgi:hypothetical protein
MALRDFFGRLRGGAAQPAPEMPAPTPEAAPAEPLLETPPPAPEPAPEVLPAESAEAPAKTGWFARQAHGRRCLPAAQKAAG